MLGVTLLDSIYTPIADIRDKGVIKANAIVIDCIIRDHIKLIGTNGAHTYADSGHHYFCSTMMDVIYSTDSIDANNIVSLGFEKTQTFMNAYECACWGFCIRYHLDNKKDIQYFSISVMDINLMEQNFWASNSQWGKSGFGITTLFFEVTVSDDKKNCLIIGKASSDNNIIGFTSAAKLAMANFEANCLALPFFPEKMSIPVRRSLKDISLLSDYHSIYGHAFGSDPWIALIKDYLNGSIKYSSLVCGSLALRGYYCFVKLNISKNLNAKIQNEVVTWQ